jgi:hypothetical protein
MALRLDLEFGANDAFRGVDRLIDGMKSLESHVKALTQAFRGSKSSTASAADDIDKTARAARSAVGPMERLARAKAQLASAEASGNPNTVFDAKHALLRAQKGVQRADALMNPSGPAGIADLIATSRLAIGPNGKMQLMPLVNRMMASGLLGRGSLGGILSFAGGSAGGAALGGMSAAAGPVGLAVAAIAFLGVAAKTAAETITEFSKAQFAAGGTGSQTAQLVRMSAALGIDAPGRARQFGERIWTDGIAKGMASRLGIDVRGGPFGNLNDAQKYLRAVEALSDPTRTTDSQAMRMARSFGMDDELLLRRASPGMRSQALGAMGREFSPDEQMKAADAQIAMNLAMADFKIALTDIGTDVLPTLTEGLQGLSWGLRNIGLILNPGSWGAQLGAKLVGKGSEQAKTAAAMDSHTQAMAAHTQALNRHTGIVGGRAGVRGAVPRAWKYQIADQGLRDGAIGMGGANLGGMTL